MAEDEDLTERLRSALMSRALYPDRDRGSLEDLAKGSRRFGEFSLDKPFAAALRVSLPPLLNDHRNLYAFLMAAERFARFAGPRQIGAESRRFIKEAALSPEGQLERFRSGADSNAARIRGAALQLARAASIPLGAKELDQEQALRDHARPLWLAIRSRELNPRIVQREYLQAINEQKLGADDLIYQLDGLLDYPGYEFTYPIVEALYQQLLDRDPAQAQRLRRVVERRKPEGWTFERSEPEEGNRRDPDSPNPDRFAPPASMSSDREPLIDFEKHPADDLYATFGLAA